MKHLLSALLLLPAILPALPEAELKDDAGNTIVRYVIEVPPGIGTAKQVGLFLCFQEHDTPTGNDLFPVRQALLRQGVLDNYILLAAAPQSRKFGIADHKPIEKLIAWARMMYPVNPRRIYMFGKGEGSKISMEFAMAHPSLVTAAIGYSWGAWLMPAEVDRRLDFENKEPEIYLTLGRRDLDHHLTCVRDAHLRLRAKGYHLIYREFDELNDRSYHPPSNDDAIAWATRLRNKNVPLSPEEKKMLQQIKSPVNGYYPDIALVGGQAAGMVLEKLFRHGDAAVRAAAAETCRHGVFSAATTKALAKLTADSDVRVRQAAIGALSLYANWRYQAAQSALIQLATDESANLLDRINAADGLAYAVRLQVKGSREDPAMFQALVTLLRDKEEPVRAVAVAALAPAYEKAPAGAPKRRSPDGGWEPWLAAITAGAASPSSPGNFEATLTAAQGGNTAAQTAVGMMYANGQGVAQNYSEAAKWWTKAAQGGDLVAARYALDAYRFGPGVPRDTATANQMAALIGEPLLTPQPQAAAQKK